MKNNTDVRVEACHCLSCKPRMSCALCRSSPEGHVTRKDAGIVCWLSEYGALIMLSDFSGRVFCNRDVNVLCIEVTIHMHFLLAYLKYEMRGSGKVMPCH